MAEIRNRHCAICGHDAPWLWLHFLQKHPELNVPPEEPPHELYRDEITVVPKRHSRRKRRELMAEIVDVSVEIEKIRQAQFVDIMPASEVLRQTT